MVYKFGWGDLETKSYPPLPDCNPYGLQSKITSAEDKLNSVANYVTNNPEINEGKQVGDRNINQDDVKKGDTDKEKELM